MFRSQREGQEVIKITAQKKQTMGKLKDLADRMGKQGAGFQWGEKDYLLVQKFFPILVKHTEVNYPVLRILE